MKIGFGTEDEAFRQEVAHWLEQHLQGEFEQLRFRGGPGDEHMFPEERKAWEREMAKGGWIGLGWPRECGGRGLSISQRPSSRRARVFTPARSEPAPGSE